MTAHCSSYLLRPCRGLSEVQAERREQAAIACRSALSFYWYYQSKVHNAISRDHLSDYRFACDERDEALDRARGIAREHGLTVDEIGIGLVPEGWSK